MYSVTAYLYKNDKLLLKGMWEDLEFFVEVLKEANPNFIDRRDFKITNIEGVVIKEWKRK